MTLTKDILLQREAGKFKIQKENFLSEIGEDPN